MDQSEITKSSCYTRPEERLVLTWSDVVVSYHVENKNKTVSNSFRQWIESKTSRRSSGKPEHPSTKQDAKEILRGSYGYARPGQLTVIIGSSGAGKSTLMNVMAGRTSRTLTLSGQVLINGRSSENNRQQLAQLSSYLQQDDVFHPLLTVGETMWFYGKLRTPDDDRALQQRINSILFELGLTKVVDVLVGDAAAAGGGGANKRATLSGGERKRLAFAVETLSNPPVFFCDEPTTGLDVFMAETVVTSLKHMAQQGKTIIATLHQPSSHIVSLIDSVIIMNEGQTAFIGSITELSDYFTNIIGSPCPSDFNLFDHVMAVLMTKMTAVVPSNENAPRESSNPNDAYWPAQFRATPFYTLARQRMLDANGNKTDKHVDSPGDQDADNGNLHEGHDNTNGSSWLTSRTHKSASLWCQYKMTIWRESKVFKRNKRLFTTRIISAIARAVLLSLIFANQQYDQLGAQNMIGLLYVMITHCLWENVDAYMASTPKEIAVYLRDQQTSLYSPGAHFVATQAFEIPQNIFNTFTYTTIVYFSTNLNYWPISHFFVTFAVLSATALTATGIGYWIGFIFENRAIANALRRAIAPLFSHTAGIWVNISTIPAAFSWLSYLSIMYYCNELLQVNQWGDVEQLECPASSDYSASCYANGADILQYYGYSTANIARDIGAVVALIVGIRFCAYLTLVIRTIRTKNEG